MRYNNTLVPTRKGEAPLLAAQRGRYFPKPHRHSHRIARYAEGTALGDTSRSGFLICLTAAGDRRTLTPL